MTFERIRKTLFLMLAGVGLGLFLYGAMLRLVPILPKAEGDPIVRSEPSLVKDVTIGGLILDKSGAIRLTYEGQAPQQACPT